jgi:hypothetical protein
LLKTIHWTVCLLCKPLLTDESAKACFHNPTVQGLFYGGLGSVHSLAVDHALGWLFSMERPVPPQEQRKENFTQSVYAFKAAKPMTP